MVLHRYILRQILTPFLAVFLSLALLFLMVQLLKLGELSFGAGLYAADLVWLSLHFMPVFAVWILPVSVMAGVLLGVVRMAEDGELVALAAAGCSRLRLAFMPLFLGGLASALAFVLSAWLAPAAAAELQRNLVQMAKRHVVSSLKPGQFFEEIPRVVIYTGEDGDAAGSFHGFMLHDRRPGKPRHLLLARQARLESDRAGEGLLLQLFDGQVHARGHRGRYTRLDFERAEMGLNIERLIHDRTKGLPALDSMSLERLALEAGRAPEPEARRLNAAWHRRIAFPFASLALAWLALALSGHLRTRRGTLLVAAAVVLGYYLLMRLGDGLLRPGLLAPALAAWMPNLILMTLLALDGLRHLRRRS